MLENKKHGTYISNSSNNSFRKAWIKFFRSFRIDFKSFFGRLQGMGKGKFSDGLDEEIQDNVSQSNFVNEQDMNIIEENLMKLVEAQSNKNSVQEQIVPITREQQFALHKFEWVKSERAGDICEFSNFNYESDIEYVIFTDGSRVRTDMIGDVILMHRFNNEILGRDMLLPSSHVEENNILTKTTVTETSKHKNDVLTNPVAAILDKTKKRNEKITLTLNVKIPSVDVYNVIKENFDDVDDVLLASVMDQIHEQVLRDSLKKELQNIYTQKKKKIIDGKNTV